MNNPPFLLLGFQISLIGGLAYFMHHEGIWFLIPAFLFFYWGRAEWKRSKE